MKITIEASEPTSIMGSGKGSVVVDTGHDTENTIEMCEVMRRAMTAWGFDQNSVDQAIIEFADQLNHMHNG